MDKILKFHRLNARIKFYKISPPQIKATNKGAVAQKSRELTKIAFEFHR